MMEKFKSLLLILSLYLLGSEGKSQFLPIKKVMILEIKSEIDPRVTRKVDIAFAEARRSDVDLIIVEMNTFGGLLDDADKIRTVFMNSWMPIYVLVNNNAASAGALISIACDSIYMTSGANIGAATVVTQTGEAAPDKYQSYMRSLMRSTAESRGRNPKIAEAMVDQTIFIPEITDDTKVLTFTTKEAIKNKYCEAEINSIQALLKYHKLENVEVVHFELSSMQKVSDIFLNPIISGVLIMLIIGGLYFELQTPGIGFPLAASVIAACLYFIPFYLEGLAQNWEILLFFFGFLLLLAEIFVIPGFGVAGISGIVFIFSSLLLAMLNNFGFDFSPVRSVDMKSAFVSILLAMLGSVVLVILGGKKVLKSAAFRRLVHQETLPSPSQSVLEADHLELLIGKQGIAKTDLRPSGKVDIDGSVYDAFTKGRFLQKGQQILVKEYHHHQLLVEKI